MFKNEVSSLRRRSAAYDAHLARLANALRLKKPGDDDALTTLLWGGLKPELYEHQTGDSHKACSRGKNESNEVKEPRICRCMRFYDATSPKCQTCTFPAKRANGIPAFQITDNEQPTRYKMDKLGGIDLVWQWRGTDYAVEVKPPNSPETILRMAAEILTYTWHDVRYTPAICFFKYKWERNEATGQYRSTEELSEQAKEYDDRREDDNFQAVLGAVHLFYITLDHDAFYLHDNGEEPL